MYQWYSLCFIVLIPSLKTQLCFDIEIVNKLQCRIIVSCNIASVLVVAITMLH